MKYRKYAKRNEGSKGGKKGRKKARIEKEIISKQRKYPNIPPKPCSFFSVYILVNYRYYS